MFRVGDTRTDQPITDLAPKNVATQSFRLWKLLNSTAGAASVGTTAGSYAGYVFGPAVIDVSVRFACNRLIQGIVGKMVGAIAAPAFTCYFGTALIPVGGFAGCVTAMVLYYSGNWVYQYFCPPGEEQTKQIDHNLLDAIRVLAETYIYKSAKDPDEADQMMSSLKKNNPEMGELLEQAIAHMLQEQEEMRAMEEDWELVESPKLFSEAQGDLTAVGLPEQEEERGIEEDKRLAKPYQLFSEAQGDLTAVGLPEQAEERGIEEAKQLVEPLELFSAARGNLAEAGLPEQAES